MRKYFRQALLVSILGAVTRRALTFFVGFVFAILCFIGLNTALKPASKSEFCGTKCHSMHTALHTWKLSTHGGNIEGLQAECIDCHLPSKDNYFAHVTAKMYDGVRSFYKHLFGGEYDVEKGRVKVLDRMKNKKCMRCHVSLLQKPSSDIVREAHMEVLNSSDTSEETKCIECHEEVGHQR